MTNNVTTHEQDIRPSLGQILESYQRLDYKVHNALAEFVDNSTASYFINKDKLHEIFGPDYVLKININYNQLEGKHGSLEIIDNAYGMDLEVFNNAVTISRKPTTQGGRNEYGMGLKTAASWFGKKWELKSQRPGNNKLIHTTISIEDLLLNKKNSIEIFEDDNHTYKYSTYIKIHNLNRRITNNDLNKLKQEIESIYRRDILSKKVKIYINGELCKFLEPEFYAELDLKNGQSKIWKFYFNEMVQFEDTTYPISGYIGILGEGYTGYANAGFTLFRRGRVIIGGYKKNYKPAKIFGSSNSFRSFRLYGEIHLDTFPITQSKNTFDWDSFGLEDAFIEKLFEISKDYSKKCDDIRSDKQKIDSKENIKGYATEAYTSLNKSINENKIVHPEIDSIKEIEEDNIKGYSIFIKSSKNRYNVTVEYIRDPFEKLYIFEDGSKDEDANSFRVKINLAFPLFNDLNINKDFQNNLHKLLVYMALAEKISLSLSNEETFSGEPLVRHNLFRNIFNEILKESSDNY